jgi:hypothetical protein
MTLAYAEKIWVNIITLTSPVGTVMEVSLHCSVVISHVTKKETGNLHVYMIGIYPSVESQICNHIFNKLSYLLKKDRLMVSWSQCVCVCLPSL